MNRPNQALDGGWGYIIILSSFIVAFMLDGVENSYGVLLPAIVETYDANYFVATLCGGMLTGVCLGMGPLTALLVRRFGCRPVAFTGGVVTCISLAMATRAEAIEMFIVCYGVLSGIGIGLIYLPSITMINMYFNKRRGIAVGIVTSGSGVGLLVMALVIDRLMSMYGWRGCYLIIAGLYLHLCACACLMRPLEDNFRTRYGDASDTDQEDVKKDLLHKDQDKDQQCKKGCTCNLHTIVENGSLGSSTLVVTKSSKDSLEPHSTHDALVVNDSKDNMCPDCSGKDVYQINGKTLPHQNGDLNNCQICHSKEAPFSQVLPELSVNYTKGGEGSLSEAKITPHENGNAEVVPTSVPSSTTTPLGSGQSLKDSGIHSSHHNHHRHHHCLHQHYHQPHHHQHHHYSHLSVSDKDDAGSFTALDLPSDKHAFLNMPPECISVSTLSINTIRSRSKSQHSELWNSHHSLKTRSHVTLRSESQSSIDEEVPEANMISYNPFSLLKIIRFDLFCVGAFLVQIAASIPGMFLPSYAMSLGLDASSAASIVSILGISNTVGRLAAGLLANLGLGSLRVYNSGTFLAGVACYLLPLCTNYGTLVAFAVGHGFFIGFFPPLQSVILVEQLGIDRLPASFGIVCLCKSVASMAGPSLAGALYEMVGTYSVPFYFAGGIVTLSNIIHVIMSLCPKPGDV